MAAKILAFAGSLRAESWNKKVLRIAVGAARAAGAEVTEIDLKEFSLPLLDGDVLEKEGLPPGAKKLKGLFLAHAGLLIASPEHNAAPSAALKNAIDWVSRSGGPGDPPLAAFAGKVAGLVSASTGQLGGLRGLVVLRAILGNIRVLVLPEQVAVSNAAQAFEADGRLKEPKQQAAVENVARELARVAGRLYA
jgi:NAD(P)H-dependent FMN reductase